MLLDTVPKISNLFLTPTSQAIELDLTPLQGMWTEQQYLALTNQTNNLLELNNGEIEVLNMPTERHQAISQFLFLSFLAFVRQIGGIVRYAPLRLRIRAGSYREPDLLLVCDAQDVRRQNQYWLGADLVLEVVSPDDPERDLITKRHEYAEAGIPEYWIVNPINETIIVLTLADEHYAEHGVFSRGMQATSRLLDGFSVDVASVFDAQ